MIRVGILAVQGAVTEHRYTVERTLESMKIQGEAIEVRTEEQLESSDALIIPGGESTTISKLIVKFGLADPLKSRVANEDFPVMGTCAGSIMLASEGDSEVEKTGTQLLSIMDMKITRNAFGRQRESFEMPLIIEGISTEEAPFPGVFIRAPLILEASGGCNVLGRMPKGEGIIAARQDRRLALVFHPELTDDLRLHRFFIESI